MSVTSQPGVDACKGSAEWYVSELRLNGQAELVPMNRESYDASSFLDRRIQLPPDAQVYELPFNALHPLFTDVSQLQTRYLFHISHVGSTLISKLIGSNPDILSLREPVLLRNLAEYKQKLGDPESRMDRQTFLVFLRTALGLIGRPLAPASNVVVKATSFANVLAADILNLLPQSRAVGIYSRFDNFAATILKGAGGWSDILHMAPSRMKRLHVMLGRQPWQLWRLSPGQVTAMSWLCEMATLISAGARSPDRLSWIEFDRFMDDPEKNIMTICSALQLHWTVEDSNRMASSGLLSVYGKSKDRIYSLDDRNKELDFIKSHQAVIIAEGKDWILKSIKDHPELSIVSDYI